MLWTSLLSLHQLSLEIDAFTSPIPATLQGRPLRTTNPGESFVPLTHRVSQTSVGPFSRSFLLFSTNEKEEMASVDTKEKDNNDDSDAVVDEENEESNVNGESKGDDSDVVTLNTETKEETKKEVSLQFDPKVDNGTHSKLTRLKDKLWVREALEDLTSAEFACSLSPSKDRSDKRAVDFENIASQLARRIEEMCVKGSSDDPACIAFYPLTMGAEGSAKEDEECFVLKKNFGMGSVTYTDEQRDALLQ